MTLEILLSSALRLLLLGAAVWLVLRISRVRNPHVEALTWRMVLVASLALPALLYWRLAPSFATSLDLPAIAIASEGGASALPVTAADSWLSARAVVTIYLGIGLLLLVRLVSGLAAMWRISRAARPMTTPDDVRTSAHIRSPATFGTIILLPAGASAWPAERLDAVLAHERAHVQFRDGLWSWLSQVHTAIFWFSPLSWWLQRRLETLAETTSDDAVVAARHDPVAYAALLLDFARKPNSRSVAMSVAESNVPDRIERLLARIPPAAALPRVARWSAFALLIPMVVLAASTTRAAAPAEPGAAPVAPVATGQMPAEREEKVHIRAAADPDDYYPAIARQERVSGRAVVEVTVDPAGQFLNAKVVEVTPADPRYGFADAAVQVARRTQYKNPRQEVSSTRFAVIFGPKTPRPGVRLTRAADPDNYFPAAAKAEKVSGDAVVEVDLDALGQVVDARVLEVQPADPRFGFADAALQVARNAGFVNETQKAASMRFKVKFELAE